MQVDQITRMMQLLEMQNNIANAGNTGSGNTDSLFETMLEGLMQTGQGTSIPAAADESNSEASGAVNGINGMSLQPDKIVQMMQMLALGNMYSGSGNDGGGSNNSMGVQSDGMQLFLQGMLQSMMQNGNDSSPLLSDLLDGTSELNNVNSVGNSAGLSLDNINNDKVPKTITDAIDQASQKYGVDKALIQAVVKQESSYNPNAVSKAGAMGLMQLMPYTAREYGVSNPFDPVQNINGGTQMLKTLLDNFNGNKELALAAYNGGAGRMDRLGVDTVSEINKMPDETINYVQRVMGYYSDYKEA